MAEDKLKHYLRDKAWRERHRHPCAVCGKPILKQSTHCLSCRIAGDRSPFWNGGKMITSDGYRRIFLPNHPAANQKGYVLEHRLVMEKYLGRTLLPTEIVHHINGDHLDNRIENLRLFSSIADHVRAHGVGKNLAAWNKKMAKRRAVFIDGKRHWVPIDKYREEEDK